MIFLVPPELGARGLKSIHATQQISLDVLVGWIDAGNPTIILMEEAVDIADELEVSFIALLLSLD